MSDTWMLPAIPVSCGALIRDAADRLLVVKPTYKSGWTIPGGIMEADGETPWEGCRREVREEVGLEVRSGRLVVVDTRAAKADEPLGIRFLFDTGVLAEARKAEIRLQAGELSECRFVTRAEALQLLRPRIARRVAAGWEATSCVYLEDGRPVAGVGAAR